MKYFLMMVLVILSALSIPFSISAENDGTPAIGKNKVDYTLPYPGVLPDHPLYMFKRVRDYIFEQIIVEPIRKSEFYLLQADKRLEMGIMLFEQRKFVLSETTLSKAEKYMEKSVRLLVSQKETGSTISAHSMDTLKKALAKHEEVLTELLSQMPEEQKQGVLSSITLVQTLLKEVQTLK